MFHTGLVAAVSAGALLLLTGCAIDAGEKAAVPPPTLTIKGALAYRERIALPPDSVAVIELRDSVSGDGAVVVEQRIRLAGKQVPVPFELPVDRAALVADTSYGVRAAILQGARASWASEGVAIDPAQAVIDLGTLTLTTVQPLAFASTLRCGDQKVTVGMAGDSLNLLVDGASYSLYPVSTASGAKYEAAGDPTTTFWSKGERARLVLKGKTYPECVRADAAAPVFRATGNEPGWVLEIGARIVFTRDGGAIRIDAPAPPATAAGASPAMAVGESRQYVVDGGGRTLQVTIDPYRCTDSMSGMPYPATVAVVLDGQTLHGCGGDPAVLLQGAEWVVEEIAGTGIVERSRVTLNFGADGRLTGAGSCNRYMGSYALSGEGLSISKTASTLMACTPALMAQERQFHEILSRTARFTFSTDGALILETGAGQAIRARRE